MVDNVSSNIRSGWYYTLPLSSGSFEMCFHVQISLVNPENLRFFSGVNRTRRGLVGLKYILFISLEK